MAHDIDYRILGDDIQAVEIELDKVLPPASGMWATSGHFAGIVIDPTPMFSAVTNPVAITIAQ